jgi:ElaB/YqjD/DUF883 family membrane-anchored ribosome-binding protein
MNDISKDLHVIIDDAEQLLQHVKREAGSEVGEACERLERSLEAGKARLRTTREAVSGRVQKTVHATDGYVHRKPWTAIGVGAGIGLLAGFLVGARK